MSTPEEYNYNAFGLIPGDLGENETRLITELVRIAQEKLGLEVDGKLGPKTREAVERSAKMRAVVAVAAQPVNWIGSILHRAKQALDWQVEQYRAVLGSVIYGLGFGGKDINASHPFEWHAATKKWRCDCSGFLAWLYKVPRVRDLDPGPKRDEWWFYTDSMESDARGKVRGDLGDGVPFGDRRAADIIVFGKGSQTGHCGALSSPDKVIHCASRGGLPPITETGLDVFVRNNAVILRLRPDDLAKI